VVSYLNTRISRRRLARPRSLPLLPTVLARIRFGLRP